MKNKIRPIRPIGRIRPFLAATLALSSLLLLGAAVKDGYVTRTATSPTNTAEVFFPQNPTKAIRLVSWDVQTDNNTAALWIISGTTPYTILGILNNTNLQVVSNTNIQTGGVFIVQRADDTIFSLSVLSTNQSTNIVISATNSVQLLTNDVIWACTNTAFAMLQSLGSAAVTNVTRNAGECLFMAQRRAPMALRITNGVNLNTRITATVRYDDNAP